MADVGIDHIIDHVFAVFRGPAGEVSLGESVTQMQHALQVSSLAEAAGASASLVTAALLHDFGHFIAWSRGPPSGPESEGDHALLAADYLGSYWTLEVTEPIRLHVWAVEYLCAEDPGYFESLSPVVRAAFEPIRQLELRTNTMNESLYRRFHENPFGGDALRLRRWDDLGKDPTRKVHDLEYFRRHLEATRRHTYVVRRRRRRATS